MVLGVSATGAGVIFDQQRIIFRSFAHGDSSVARFFGGRALPCVG
jgi:hypothetical protein